MTSVRSALTATAIAALGAVFAFGPNVLELGMATRQAEAAQRAAELAHREAREAARPSAGPTRVAASKPAPTGAAKPSSATPSSATPSSAKPSSVTAAPRRVRPHAYPTMAVPPGVPAAPRPPTHENGRPIAYLTFDDGPDPTWTPQVLALLARFGAQATFFVVGEEAARFPRQLAAVEAAGHAVGNHTYTHPWLTKLKPAQVAAELARTDAVIGGSRCVRPPGGFVDAAVGRVIARGHKVTQLWDIDTRDWARPGVPAIVAATTAQLRPGVTILMHDGGGDRAQSVRALATVLPALAAKGYVFRSLPACR